MIFNILAKLEKLVFEIYSNLKTKLLKSLYILVYTTYSLLYKKHIFRKLFKEIERTLLEIIA